MAAYDKLKVTLAALIEEAQSVQDQARPEKPGFHSWFSRAEQAAAVLGPQGATFARRLEDVQDPDRYKRRLEDITRERRGLPLPTTPVYRWMVVAAADVLDGIAKAIDAGLLTAIEDRVASDIYGDVLAEARTLLDASHHSCAAILVRVGLESGLRRRAVRDGMSDAEKAKASAINQWLWKNKVYHKQTFEAVESWLAPGNAFAHDLAEKTKYTHRDIAKALDDVQSFLGTLLV